MYASILKLLKISLLWAVSLLNIGKLSGVMEHWRMKQNFFYAENLHPKYLALTIMEAGVSREDGHKMCFWSAMVICR